MTRRIAQLAAGTVAAATFAFAAMSCGSSPSTPTPVPIAPKQQAPAVNNAAPVINSVTAAVARTEVNTDVTVTADVTDVETPVDKLVFTWTANAGQITGTGPTVTYRLPKDAVLTPVSVTVSVQVTENYTDNGVAKQNVTTASASPVLVHDSTQELGDMALKFLIDLFGNSNISPSACLVDFSDSCPGKQAEFDDIVTNRQEFRIYGVSATVSNVEFNAPASSATFAWITAPCDIHDHHFPNNRDGDSIGSCDLTAVYEQERWWLCQSSFDHATCGSCLVANHPKMTLREFLLSGLKDR